MQQHGIGEIDHERAVGHRVAHLVPLQRALGGQGLAHFEHEFEKSSSRYTYFAADDGVDRPYPLSV